MASPTRLPLPGSSAGRRIPRCVNAADRLRPRQGTRVPSEGVWAALAGHPVHSYGLTPTLLTAGLLLATSFSVRVGPLDLHGDHPPCPAARLGNRPGRAAGAWPSAGALR